MSWSWYIANDMLRYWNFFASPVNEVQKNLF